MVCLHRENVSHKDICTISYFLVSLQVIVCKAQKKYFNS